MPYRKRARKPIKGQVDLLGGVYDFRLVYQPQVSKRPGELYQVVTRIPADKTDDEMYRAVADAAAREAVKTIVQPNLNYWKNHKYIDKD